MPLTPEGLNALYNAPISATFQADALRNQLMQSGELANQASSIRNLYDQQNNPGLVEQTKLENQSKLARLPGELANSRSLQLRTGREEAGQQDAITLARQKFLKDASDNDISMLENRAQQMAYSTDPTVRSQGEQLLRMHKDIVKEKAKEGYKADRQLELEKQRGSNMLELAGVNNAAGRYNKSGSGLDGDAPTENLVRDLEASIAAGKLGYEKSAAGYQALAQRAYREGNTTLGDQLLTISNQYTAMRLRDRQAGVDAGQAGKPDLHKLSNGGVPVIQRPPMPTFKSPAQLAEEDRANGVAFSSPAAKAAYEKSQQGKLNQQLMSKLPAGTKDNGDGTFTLPNGQRVRPKQ